MMLLNQTLQHFHACYLFACLQPLSRGKYHAIQFGSLKPVIVQLSQEASDYNDDKRSAMDEEEGWMMVTRRRWKKRRTFPLYLITQESKKAQNQIQPRLRERSDKRQGRLGTKIFDNLAKTQKPRKLITLEEFFPRKFFQNNSVEVVHIVSCCEI